jgi:hypothetical protein
MMYVDLIVRLHADIAAAVNEAIRVRAAKSSKFNDAPLNAAAGDVQAFEKGGRWHARVNRAGWLGSITSEAATGYSSEAEALCSLVERAQREAEDAGGIPPLHLLGRLAQDADELAVYRGLRDRLVKAGIVALLGGLDELDAIGEASPFAREMDALRRAAGA